MRCNKLFMTLVVFLQVVIRSKWMSVYLSYFAFPIHGNLLN